MMLEVYFKSQINPFSHSIFLLEFCHVFLMNQRLLAKIQLIWKKKTSKMALSIQLILALNHKHH